MIDFIQKIKLEKWHFCLLGFILINFGIGLITGYRLNQNLIFSLKIVLYLTGLILFLTTIRSFRTIVFYYSFYIFSGVITGLFFLFGGIFLAILSSLVLFPIFPSQTKYKTETMKIYDRYQGFFARCCSYEIVEPKFYILEKHIGYIRINEPIGSGKGEFVIQHNSIIYKYKLDNDGQKTRDTSEVFYFE